MRELLKVLCVVLFMVGSVASAIAWVDRSSTPTIWVLRAGGAVLALASLAAFLKLHFARDLATDYLRRHCRSFFDRDGFAFSVDAASVDGTCCLLIHFQNQRDRPCVARVVLRPRPTTFVGPAALDPVEFELRCDPAAFGKLTIPLSLPPEIQGKRQPFVIGASVQHPDGRGKLLRFRSGAVIRSNANFANPFHASLAVAGVMVGKVFISRPARLTLRLPKGVAAVPPSDRHPAATTLWRLGDPPLEDAA